jgi:hypothetical protein
MYAIVKTTVGLVGLGVVNLQYASSMRIKACAAFSGRLNTESLRVHT